MRVGKGTIVRLERRMSREGRRMEKKSVLRIPNNYSLSADIVMSHELDISRLCWLRIAYLARYLACSEFVTRECAEIFTRKRTQRVRPLV